MSNRVVGGIIQFKANGQIYRVKGDFTFNPGAPKREAVIGSDGVHGFKETPQVPFIEGKVTDTPDTDTVALFALKDATAYLDLANGKAFVLRNAWYAGDGNHTTEEGEVDLRFEGMSGEVVPA